MEPEKQVVIAFGSISFPPLNSEPEDEVSDGEQSERV